MKTTKQIILNRNQSKLILKALQSGSIAFRELWLHDDWDIDMTKGVKKSFIEAFKRIQSAIRILDGKTYNWDDFD